MKFTKRLNWLFLFIFSCIFVSFFLSWKNSSADSQIAIDKEDEVWVVTDLHYLSPKLHDGGKAFSIMQNTAAGKDLVYGKERLEALLFQVKKEKPKLLIVSGDLTFNGEYQSLVETSGYFQQIEKAGTQVLVIPGNHDIASGWAREFREDKQYKTKQILASDFESVMVDFGYADADARDQVSLTYVTKLQSGPWFLMIDSNIYSDAEGKGAPTTNGRLKKETLAFIEEQLQDAQEEGAFVVPVMHHNVLEQHPMSTRGFTLDNASDLRHLYSKYQQKIALSGHIHTQNMASWTMEDGHTLTEIVTGAFSLYPASIGRLTFKDDQVDYEQTRLDMKDWAEQEKIGQPDLLEHANYLKDVFNKSSNIMVHTMMNDEGWYDGEKAEEISEMIEPLNLAFFTGEMLTEDWLSENVYTNDIYHLIRDSGEKNFLYRYVNQMISERANKSAQKVSINLP